MAGLLGLAIVAVLATDVFALWFTANNTTYTAGQKQNPPPSYPGSTGLDGKFTRLPPDAGGHRGISFTVIGCCLRDDFCTPPTPDKGVFVDVNVTVTTPNGPVQGHGSATCCPADCCELDYELREGTPGNWGGPATSVSIDVFVQCICCGENMQTGEDYYEYPTQGLTPG
jgi:hypothetical protein